jgi:hypothetical protein
MKSIRKSIFVALLAALALSGCASDYPAYIAAQQAQADAVRHSNDVRAVALVGACSTGIESACLAATFALGMQQGGGAQAQTQIAPPKSFGEQALQWASVLVPGAVQLGQAHLQFKSQEVQSNNSRILGVAQIDGQVNTARSTNETMLGIAGHIQAPVTVVPQANISNTISGQGVIGAGTFTTVNRSINSSYNPVDNSQRNPIDNSNQGNPIDNSNQGNPVTAK